MRQSHTDITVLNPSTRLYTTVEYRLPEGTYTKGVRRARPPAPHDCHSCGSLAMDPNPAYLVDGIYIDCPRCPSRPPSENGNSAAEQLSADVRDIMADEAARGSGKSSSSGSSSRKRPRPRAEIRVEQELTLRNGHSGDRARITRLEKASERFELQLTIECRERLREVSHDRRNEYGAPYPQSQLVRDAIYGELKRLDSPREVERGTDRAEPLQLRLYPNDLLLIDAAANFWQMSRPAVIEAALWQLLGE